MSKNVALFIDVENTQASLMKNIIQETSRFGRITHKRAYADFDKLNLKNWKIICAIHGLEQVQQFAYVSKRGTTDGSLICDAMEMLYESHVDIYCIVSSECDFAKLAMKL